MTYALISQRDADSKIAQMFGADRHCEVLVSEDRVFDGKWLSLGNFELLSRQGDAEDISRLVRDGAFEWVLPKKEEIGGKLAKILGIDNNGGDAKLVGAMRQIAAIAVRVGLAHPTFDPSAIEEMPFRRPTTVVTDTSAVMQGALDFVAGHLYPAARVKVPAIVSMEIENTAQRFFSLRRKTGSRSGARKCLELVEHLKSQGGQRALLRLELRTEIEIERTYLLGDPLRNAFKTDNPGEVAGLSLSVPNRSYVDRLILEAARHHQAQSGPDHVVRLLTSDQGLARMALVEGVRPIFFAATRAADVFGRRLAGQTFSPFSGRIHRAPLSGLLWEMATAIGSVRLKRDDGQILDIAALGQELSWAPYHADDDLLWWRCRKPSASIVESSVTEAIPSQKVISGIADQPRDTFQHPVRLTFFRFSVDRMVTLLFALDDRQQMREDEIAELLGVSVKTTGEFRRFLESGSMITVDFGVWKAAGAIRELTAALRNERVEQVAAILARTPTFKWFASRIAELGSGNPLDRSELGRGSSNYAILGELTRMVASIRGEGIFPTPNRPRVNRFAEIALERFSELEDGKGLVPTGAWLEALIRSDGIHPEVSRQRLDEASKVGLLTRTTEGSTLQTRFDDHVLHVMRNRLGTPAVDRVHLYRGDYLIPGKASVSLRIEEPK